MKKYGFTGETKVVNGTTLKRIVALKDFADVKRGEFGGFIESEKNLTQSDNSWVYDNACVMGNARVYSDAKIAEDAYVYGNACVAGKAKVLGHAKVYEMALVAGYSRIFGNADVDGDFILTGNAVICGNACIRDDSDYMFVGLIGRFRNTVTFFKDSERGIIVKNGCFYGTIEEFRVAVKETHGTDTKHAKVYQAAADLAEMQILDQEAE